MEAFVFHARCSRVVLSALAIVALPACSKPAGPTRLESLEQLASLWSHGRAEHTCQRLGPIGEYLGPGRDYCQWLTAVQGRAYSTVGIFRDSSVGFTHLRWERTLRDPADHRRVVDSLNAALLTQDFVAWDCPKGGRYWEGKRFTVRLLSTSSDNPYRQIVVFVFTNAARPTDDPFCPTPKAVKDKRPGLTKV